MNLRYYSTVQFQRFNCSIYLHELNELSFKTIKLCKKDLPTLL
jgi:hypothetical protein